MKLSPSFYGQWKRMSAELNKMKERMVKKGINFSRVCFFEDEEEEKEKENELLSSFRLIVNRIE